MRNPIGWLLVGLARFYQLVLSPLKPPTCRFHPTCSSYFIDAVRIHGPVRGAWLGARRILRCHPFHPGGYDPVPGDTRDTADADSAGGEPTCRGPISGADPIRGAARAKPAARRAPRGRSGE